MARIRSIKPEFWSNEQVMECAPFSRLLFIGLWNFCDDGGNHPLSEKTIKALVFPGDSITPDEIRRAVADLSSNGLLRLFECSGKLYLNVPGWKHQKIEKPTYKHPFFEDGKEVFPHEIWAEGQSFAERSSNSRRIVADSSATERKGSGEDIDQDQKTCSSPSAEHVEFDRFWKLYPRKVGKQKAMSSWNKLKPDMILFAEIERALEIAKRSPDWLKSAGQYIPHPSVWLNGRRWEDEQDPAAALPFEEIAAAYNEICGKVFKPCEVMTPDRMLLVRGLASQEIKGRRRFIEGGIEYWRRFFTAAASSRRWAGENQSGFIADFDHVIRNAAVVFEASQ